MLDYGRLKLNLTAREVLVDGQSVVLTPKEYELLKLFAEHPKHVISYEQLLAKFWDGVGDKHTIRVHLSCCCGRRSRRTRTARNSWLTSGE